MKATGTLRVSTSKKRIVLDVSEDLIGLYLWFIKKKFWYQLGQPAHGAHITLTNPKLHDNVDWKKARQFNGKTFEFEYDENLVQGGYTKGFIMFYLKVVSPELDDLKKEIGIVEKENYRGLHITVGNGKNTNLRPYWPEIIKIRKMKNVIILRAVSGSGKSTLAKIMAGNNPNAVICSADDWFCRNGEYQFDVKELSKAHDECRRKFMNALNTPETELIIIDNTNTKPAEYKYYADEARKRGHRVIFTVVEHRHENGSVHDVPGATLQHQHESLRNDLQLLCRHNPDR